jgi:outer membrane protein
MRGNAIVADSSRRCSSLRGALVVAAVSVAALLAALDGRAAETLSDAWTLALGADATLKAASSRVAAADAALEAARAGRRPTVSASSMLTHFRDAPEFDFSAVGLPFAVPLFKGNSFTLSSAQLSVPIYTAGALGAGIDAADAGYAASAHAAETLTQEVKLAVAGAYIGVLRATSALDVAKVNTSSLTAHARDVQDMQRTGQVPRNDLLAAQVALADAEQRELQAETALEIARAAYNRQTGRPLGNAVALEESLPQVDASLLASPLPSLLDMAHDSRDELKGLAANAAELRARSSATRARLRPQLSASAGYLSLQNEFLNRQDFWTVGIGVRWSFFDGGQTRHAAEALDLQARAANEQQADLATLIELEVRSAWLNVHETTRRVQVTEAAVMQAEENLRVVSDRYRNGEGTNTEVLDAEALRSLSRSNFDNARYDAAFAEFKLARAVGAL